MARNTQKQVKYLTVSAMLAALGVILLSLGALVEVLDISVAVIASLLVVYAVIEMGGAYPWMIWLVTSIVGYLLMPKTPVLFFALFFGFSPIVKEKAERLPLHWSRHILLRSPVRRPASHEASSERFPVRR